MNGMDKNFLLLLQHCATCGECTDDVFCAVGVQLLEEANEGPVIAIGMDFKNRFDQEFE